MTERNYNTIWKEDCKKPQNDGEEKNNVILGETKDSKVEQIGS